MFRRVFVYLISFIVAGIFYIGIPQYVLAATFTVNSPEDTNDGTCTSPFVNSANDCTFREAVNAANATAPADVITFVIDASFQANPSYFSSNQFTITVASAFNAITQPVTITGVSSWDNSGNRPGIRLFSTSTAFNGLTFNSGATNSKVQGLEIQGFRNGIAILATGVTIGTDCNGTTDGNERNVLHGASLIGINVTASNVLIAGNYIGLDDDGSTSNEVGDSSISIIGASADNAVIGYRDSASSCTAAQQRNVITGARSTSTGAAITVMGTGTNNASGDASLAPNGTSIAGNYIGVDSTGTLPRGGLLGVYLHTNSTSAIVGTDGDGTNDDLESNVLYAAGTAVAITLTGNNRVSGNSIGVTSARTQTIGTGLVHGINARGNNNIIGWCDTTVHATLCSNAGTVANQANIIGGATNDGVRLGLGCDDCVVYGNWLGVGSDGTTDLGNGNSGVFIHRSTTGNQIGGSGSKTNTIKYNTTGIIADGSFIGSTSLGDATFQRDITGLVIDGNTISSNDGDGVYLNWTNNYDTNSDVDITIQNNTINENGDNGIEAIGSSPDITNNSIQTNTGNGIVVEPGLLHYDATNEAVASGDPQYASENLLAEPTISGNTIAGNNSIGIAQLDTSASNTDTLYIDNTFSTGADTDAHQTTAISQAWYAAAEVLNAAEDPIPAASWTGTAVQLLVTGTGNTTTTTDDSAATGSDVVFGPTDINYTDVTTWLQLTNYTVSGAGTRTDYGPYTISSSGSYRSNAASSYTFDGVNNDTVFSGGLANGQTTSSLSGSLYRFQIAHVLASTVPSTPTTVSPTDGATGVSLTPALQASAFEDASDTHAQSTWQVYSSSADCSNGVTSAAVINVTSSSALTSYTVSSSTLSGNTTYYWRVAYTNSFGNISAYSNCAQFTTLQTTPQQTADFPAQTLAEDTSLDTAVYVDDYFTDAEGEILSYLATVSDDNINAQIQADFEITLSAATDWFGDATVTIVACDTDNECASGDMAVSVTAVNDAPDTPTEGFSPANGDTSSSLQPTISWTAANDVDDDASVLNYTVRLSTDTDPISNPAMTLQSDIGDTSVIPTSELDDETTYYYAVQTEDAAGLQSDWSATQTFEINVSNTPSLHLTKSVQLSTQQTAWQKVKQAAGTMMLSTLALIQPARASAISADISNQIAEQSFMVLIVSISALLFSVAFVMLLARRPQHFVTALLHDVPIAFDRIYEPASGKFKISYTRFKYRLTAARYTMYVAIVVLVPAFVMNVLHAEVKNWLVQSQVSSTNVEPGESLTITLTYSNTGDGDATSAVLTDRFPNDTSFLSSTAPVDRNGHEVSFDIGTINSGDTGRVRYQIDVAEPFTGNSIQFDSAELIANETTSAVFSNSVLVSVIASTISGQVTDGNNNAIADVAMGLEWGDQQTLSDTTNTAGNYSFTGLASGTYTISATPSGSTETKELSTTVTRGGSAVVNFIFDTETETETGGNDNVNSNVNDSTNSNTNTNANSNSNSNTNAPINTNTNSNSNINAPDEITTNTNSSDILPPDDTVPDTTILPTNPDEVLSPEEQILADSFIVFDVNGNIVSASQPVLYLTDDPSQVPPGSLVFPSDTETLIFQGTTLPNSTITAQICYTIITTTSDETGAWIMVVPRSVLQQGENVITASVTQGDVEVDQIIVAHVNVDNSLTIKPKNYWINFMAIIVLFQLNVAAWLILRFRHGNTTISRKLVFLHALTLIIVLILVSLAVPQSRQVEARGHLRQTDIMARSINNEILTDQYITFEDSSALELVGSAAPDQQYSVSICPNQPFRYVTTNSDGRWSLILPVNVLPSRIITVAMNSVADRDQPEQQLVDINVQDQYKAVNRWRWIILGLIATGALITLINWCIVYRQAPKKSRTISD